MKLFIVIFYYKISVCLLIILVLFLYLFLDIDECVEGIFICDVDVECVNINGLYICFCKFGYYGDEMNCEG